MTKEKIESALRRIGVGGQVSYEYFEEEHEFGVVVEVLQRDVSFVLTHLGKQDFPMAVRAKKEP